MTLDQIREIIEAATLGPWQTFKRWRGGLLTSRDWAQIKGPTYSEDSLALEDARFIAAARTLLPALLAAVEAAEGVYDTHPAFMDWSQFAEALKDIEALKLP